VKKLIIGLLCMAGAVVGVAAPAVAANPHFVKGPTVTDNGTTLSVTGSVAGLGNEDVRVVVTATGTAVVDCRNPGGNIAPGQRKSVSVSGEQIITDVKNGRINFAVTTLAPAPPPGSCPNSSWTPILRDVQFTDADVFVYQPINSTTPVLSRDVL
jgi:hypothetical protein